MYCRNNGIKYQALLFFFGIIVNHIPVQNLNLFNTSKRLFLKFQCAANGTKYSLLCNDRIIEITSV